MKTINQKKWTGYFVLAIISLFLNNCGGSNNNQNRRLPPLSQIPFAYCSNCPVNRAFLGKVNGTTSGSSLTNLGSVTYGGNYSNYPGNYSPSGLTMSMDIYGDSMVAMAGGGGYTGGYNNGYPGTGYNLGGYPSNGYAGNSYAGNNYYGSEKLLITYNGAIAAGGTATFTSASFICNTQIMPTTFYVSTLQTGQMTNSIIHGLKIQLIGADGRQRIVLNINNAIISNGTDPNGITRSSANNRLMQTNEPIMVEAVNGQPCYGSGTSLGRLE
jgi:hypothetical protein